MLDRQMILLPLIGSVVAVVLVEKHQNLHLNVLVVEVVEDKVELTL